MSPSNAAYKTPKNIVGACADDSASARAWSASGKASSISTEHPQCEGVENLRCGARVLAEPVGEIGMPCLVVELDGLLIMLMSAGKIAEIPAGDAGNAVRDQGLGAIRSGCGFAQEKLGHFAHRCGFAARKVPDPDPKIRGKPRSEASSSRLANSRARAKAALVCGASCPSAQISALPRLVCKRSRLMPGVALGAVPALAAGLSANSIALPRCEAASLKVERRKAWSPAFPQPLDRRLVETGLR